VQAVACAQAGITLISPFVGRINDGYAAKYNKTYLAHEEPGVLLVKDIYNYYKKYDFSTIVMAASLRTGESVLELSGCDKITMPPGVIEKLEKLSIKAENKLNVEQAKQLDIKEMEKINEKTFRLLLNNEEIGSEKLSDGIRVFAKDTAKLRQIVQSRLSA
jgi:transaldolase